MCDSCRVPKYLTLCMSWAFLQVALKVRREDCFCQTNPPSIYWGSLWAWTHRLHLYQADRRSGVVSVEGSRDKGFKESRYQFLTAMIQKKQITAPWRLFFWRLYIQIHKCYVSVRCISEHNLSVIGNITGCGTVNFLHSVPFTLILTLPKGHKYNPNTQHSCGPIKVRVVLLLKLLVSLLNFINITFKHQYLCERQREALCILIILWFMLSSSHMI